MLDIKFKRLAIGIYQTIDGEESCGFLYYSKVTWKKGNFVSNTGRTEYMSGTNGMLPTMFDVQPVPKNKKIHQSEMPVGLIEQILEFVTTEGEVVLDTFAGSGVAGEACLNKKRNCILVELCHENIEKIKQRFENNLMFRAAGFQAAR